MSGRHQELGLVDLRAAVPHYAVQAPQVSGWSVGMHVHHCCLVIQAVHDALAASRPPAPRMWRSLIGRLVLWRGRFPRGRARAPEFALPADDMSPTQLTTLLSAAEQAVGAMRALDPGTWMRHFMLGTFTRDEAMRFAEVHTNHHLAIIREILTVAGTRQWQVPGRRGTTEDSGEDR